jgi:hypothetical protein
MHGKKHNQHIKSSNGGNFEGRPPTLSSELSPFERLFFNFMPFYAIVRSQDIKLLKKCRLTRGAGAVSAVDRRQPNNSGGVKTKAHENLI